MPELTDDQLDGLFRKSAEEFDPPFDPVAWRDMKTRLDANDRTTGGALIWKNLLRWALPFALLLLLTGGGWYAYRKTYAVAKPAGKVVAKAKSTLDHNTEQSQQYATTQLSDSKPTRTAPADSPESGRENGKQPADLIGSVATSSKPENRVTETATRSTTRLTPSGPSKEISATNRPTSAYKAETTRNRSSRSPLTTSISPVTESVAYANIRSVRKRTRKRDFLNSSQPKAGDNRTSAFSPTNDKLLPTVLSVTKQRKTNNSKPVQFGATSTSENTPPVEASESELVLLTNVNELAIRPATWPKLAFTDRAVAVQPDTVSRSSAIPKSASQSEKGLSVRVMVSPDLSAVGLNNFSRPGTNFGVMLEYRLASRWSVQAGIIQSTKVYRARPNEYDFPWMWPVDPTSIDGKCNMLDIPINVRYDFAVKPRLDGRLPSRWFVSGGVTSYIMKQEDYVYNYPPHTYNIKYTEFNASTGSYGFSQLNFSAGYERAFSKRLSWQVEPFIKAPLRGVGFFGVNLLSTGAFFSIRYKLSK